MRHRIVVRVGLLSLLLLVAAAPVARAQGYISPFIGFNFGGDAGCEDTTTCEDHSSNLGVAIGSSNLLFGFEEEFAYARHFFGPDTLRSGSVLTLMSNIVVGPKIGLARPYALIGAGIIKTRVDLNLTDIATSDTSFGWNIGGGLELGGSRVGVRGDVRYFHGFQDVGIPGIGITDLKLDFGRASAGLVFRF
jgi:opacity protein-like surface antigen